MEKNNDYIIQLQGLVKKYGDKTVVKGINLNIKEGEFVTFLGPSGCGKTTTLRMIAGFELPTEGKVLFDGKDIAGLPPYKRPVNTVFQKYALFPHLNVFNNIAFGLKLKKIKVDFVKKNGEKAVKMVKLKDFLVDPASGKPDFSIANGDYYSYVDKGYIKLRKIKKTVDKMTKKGKVKKVVNGYKYYIDEKVRRALKIVGLSDYETRNVDSLSGGQQQRVAIARAIVNEPKVLLLDEPLGALDLKMRQEMQLELKEMHRTLGITFIYVTHDQEEALTMSDTVVVMKDGEICQEGTPIDIYNEPKTAYVADFIGESNILDGVMIDDYRVNIVGAEFACVDSGFGQNAPVDTVIRPEDIEIKKVGKGQLEGVIKSSMFRGVHYEMLCDCNGYEFTIHSTVESPVGSKVGLYVAPENIQIMTKEHIDNTVEVTFTSNTTFDLYGGEYEFDPTALFEDCSYDADQDVLTIAGGEYTLKGEKAKVNFAFTDIDMTDDEYAAPLAGNVDSMIYKGKNYIVDIKTDDNHHVYADTQYLWDKGDRVGIKIYKFGLVECQLIGKKEDGNV
ncbi:MAG: ABC transporter ATP-binding protein [Clostridia bacterium]|nr:ABC transporter ATP-binding protein [Clostridia bacterium]MDE7328235.1 ABC transporter ATP-binding protein [Clostridia bacterium]